MRPGEVVTASDGAGSLYAVRVETMGPRVRGVIEGCQSVRAPVPAIVLTVGLGRRARLGPQRLRFETGAVAALAVVRGTWGAR